MTSPILPDPLKAQNTAARLREVCDQFDELNLRLDEFISQVDAEIKNNPLTIYRLEKTRKAQSA